MDRMLGKVAVFSLVAVTGFALAQSHAVRGYTRANGTYVAPHYSSNPNATRYDNRNSQTNGGSKRDEYSNPAATNRSNPSWGSADNDHDGTTNASDSTPNDTDNN